MEWDCKTIEVYTQEHNGYTGVVWNVHWRVTKEDGDYLATSYGSQSLNTDELNNFVPIEDVTSSIVQSWVVAAMGEEAVAEIEANLDAQIEEQKNPSTTLVTIQD